MKKLVQLMVMVVFFTACKKDESSEDVSKSFLNGVFVSNEGSFGNNNAGLTHISPSGEVSGDVYLSANNVELGDVLQSFTVIGNRGYAVLNNSQKVEVIDLATMKRVTAITGFDYPRHLLKVDDQTAYLTNGNFAGEVVIIDLSSNTVAGTIAVGNGPEKMTESAGKVFVCNSGGWANDNTISVIDVSAQSVIETVAVGDVPVDAVTDQNGDVWVLCRGKVIYDESWNVVGDSDAMLYKIDGTNHEIEYSMIVGENGDHPSHLEINPEGNVLYLENNGVFSMDITSTSFTALISGSYNSLDIHPVSGDIWCTAIPNFVSSTPVYKYSLTGQLLATYNAGIGSNGVDFN